MGGSSDRPKAIEQEKLACPRCCLKRLIVVSREPSNGAPCFFHGPRTPMLMKLQVELLGTESLLRMNDTYRKNVAATITSTCENERVRLIASEMLSADDPVEKVAELAEQDPVALAVLLRASLLVFSSLYQKQAMETELERRSQLNGSYMLTPRSSVRTLFSGGSGYRTNRIRLKKSGICAARAMKSFVLVFG